MRYILIDTNCWIELYLQVSEEKNLAQLLKWEKDGKVKLLYPDTLETEFVRQKRIQLNELKKKITGISTATQDEIKKKLKDEYKKVEAKIEKITKVLSKSTKIRNSKKIDAIVGKRYRERLAPFHLQASHNDAYIYFSTIEYLKKQKITNFVLITKNVKDFGAPGKQNTILHPELLITGIEIQYFTEIGLAVHKLKDELGSDGTSESISDADYTPIFYVGDQEKEKKTIDQVYDALNVYHDQLAFIPTHMLARLHPFKTNNIRHPEAYHSSFQLNSNNEELMRFLASFKIGKSNAIHLNTAEYKGHEKKAKAKILETFKKLNRNMIHSINGIGSSTFTDILLTRNEQCLCLRCTYNQFNIHQAFTLLDGNPQESIHETMKQAYMHYQFQQYGTALKLFNHVYENALSKGQHILMFICLTNLKRLSRLISNYGNATDHKTLEVLRKIDTISLRQARLSIPLSNPFVNEVIDWIADDNFHGKALENITTTVEKIRDHHATQLNGGFSSNSNLDVLISQFAELDLFLESNFLVFNNYLEFEKVIDRLLEGLFITYSFNSRQDSRIAFINDYLIGRIIMFCNTDNIIKYYNKYHLKSLRYQKNNTSKSEIPAIAKVYFSGLNKLYSSDEYRSKTYFLIFDKNRRIINNFLVVFTLAEEAYNFDGILESFFPLLRREEIIQRNEVNALADLISRKGKYISDPWLKKLLKFAIENKQMHERKIFQAFHNLVLNHNKPILIKNLDTFTNVQNSFLENCHLCNHAHTEILLPLIPLLSPKFKIEMQELLDKSLVQKFNADLYYMLAIGGLIDYTNHLHKFKELCVRPLGRMEGPVRPFMQGENVLYRLGELLNIYFKYELCTQEIFLEKFKGFSDYYDWILDLDGFNYKKFNPLWILEYQTEYYFRKIFRSAKVKKHLVQFLKSNKHPVLSNLFIQYY